MLGHLGLNVTDLAAAKAYYDVLMPLVGFEPFLSDVDQFAYRPAGGKPGTYLFFYPEVGPGAAYSRHSTGLQHLAFMVRTRDAVHEALEAMTALGSPVVHPPRVFPEYPQPYYAAFWLDPQGFLLEAVCHR
ncbi:MAG: extradiol dioxygenase [Acidimicrobiia bacterium]|nr:extradiol dioxygenase [Acidimicrobiia bacterium]